MKFSPEYLAGFFDGEGCIGIYYSGETHYQFTLQIVQAKGKFTRQLFNWLKEHYGGSIIRRKTYREKERISYVYWLRNTKAIHLLQMIYPFLRLKHPQARLIFEWWSLENRQKRTWSSCLIARKIKRLKRN